MNISQNTNHGLKPGQHESSAENMGQGIKINVKLRFASQRLQRQTSSLYTEQQQKEEEIKVGKLRALENLFQVENAVADSKKPAPRYFWEQSEKSFSTKWSSQNQTVQSSCISNSSNRIAINVMSFDVSDCDETSQGKEQRPISLDFACNGQKSQNPLFGGDSYYRNSDVHGFSLKKGLGTIEQDGDSDDEAMQMEDPRLEVKHSHDPQLSSRGSTCQEVLDFQSQFAMGKSHGSRKANNLAALLSGSPQLPFMAATGSGMQQTLDEEGKKSNFVSGQPKVTFTIKKRYQAEEAAKIVRPLVGPTIDKDPFAHMADLSEDSSDDEMERDDDNCLSDVDSDGMMLPPPLGADGGVPMRRQVAVIYMPIRVNCLYG